MVAVKVLAWVGDNGYPTVVPSLSLQPRGAGAMICRMGGKALPQPYPDARVSANILTFDAVSYQLKGRWLGGGRTCKMQVEEVYAGGPPLPGGRVA